MGRNAIGLAEEAESLGYIVVIAEGGWLSTNYQYLTGYKGLAFFCKSSTPLDMPQGAELVRAKKIWIPG